MKTILNKIILMAGISVSLSSFAGVGDIGSGGLLPINSGLSAIIGQIPHLSGKADVARYKGTLRTYSRLSYNKKTVTETAGECVVELRNISNAMNGTSVDFNISVYVNGQMNSEFINGGTCDADSGCNIHLVQNGLNISIDKSEKHKMTRMANAPEVGGGSSSHGSTVDQKVRVINFNETGLDQFYVENIYNEYVSIYAFGLFPQKTTTSNTVDCINLKKME